MCKIKLGEALLEKCPNIQLGLVQYEANVTPSSNLMWEVINSYVDQNISSRLTNDTYLHEKNIKDTRDAYKNLGKDPHRYRGSAEALIKRILQNKKLYQVNNVVDANNFISLISKCSVGSYDLSKLGKNLEFRIGSKNESYYGIGKDLINTEDLPIFSDEIGAYGSPTSDSRRAMITNETQNILSVIIAFSNDSGLLENLEQYKKILERFVGARNIKTCIVGVAQET